MPFLAKQPAKCYSTFEIHNCAIHTYWLFATRASSGDAQSYETFHEEQCFCGCGCSETRVRNLAHVFCCALCSNGNGVRKFIWVMMSYWMQIWIPLCFVETWMRSYMMGPFCNMKCTRIILKRVNYWLKALGMLTLDMGWRLQGIQSTFQPSILC